MEKDCSAIRFPLQQSHRSRSNLIADLLPPDGVVHLPNCFLHGKFGAPYIFLPLSLAVHFFALFTQQRGRADTCTDRAVKYRALKDYNVKRCCNVDRMSLSQPSNLGNHPPLARPQLHSERWVAKETSSIRNSPVNNRKPAI
jgi:hypothetical protein